MNTPNFELIFNATPDPYLILKADAPRFTIVAVNDSYARATNIKRQSVLGMALFELFPDNPEDKKADGVKNLTTSLMNVIATKKMDAMAVQKYDIPKPGKRETFEERYWSPQNYPVLDSEGNLVYIIHHVTDVTRQEKLLKMYGGLEDEDKDILGQLAQRIVDKMQEMEKTIRVMTGRELKMAEYKEQIAELKKKLAELTSKK